MNMPSIAIERAGREEAGRSATAQLPAILLVNLVALLLSAVAAAGGTVNYRFTLAPETAPGTYAWPIAMVVRGPTPGNLVPLAGTRSIAAGKVPHVGRDRTTAAPGWLSEP